MPQQNLILSLKSHNARESDHMINYIQLYFIRQLYLFGNVVLKVLEIFPHWCSSKFSQQLYFRGRTPQETISSSFTSSDNKSSIQKKIKP